MPRFARRRNKANRFSLRLVVLGGIGKIPDIHPDGDRSGRERNHKPIFPGIKVPEMFVELSDYLHFLPQTTVDDVHLSSIFEGFIHYLPEKLQFLFGRIDLVPELVVRPILDPIVSEVLQELRQIDDKRRGNIRRNPKEILVIERVGIGDGSDGVGEDLFHKMGLFG